MSDDLIAALSVKTIAPRLRQNLGDQIEELLIEPYQSGDLVGISLVTNTESPGRRYAIAESLQDAVDDPIKFADDAADKLLSMIRADG